MKKNMMKKTAKNKSGKSFNQEFLNKRPKELKNVTSIKYKRDNKISTEIISKDDLVDIGWFDDEYGVIISRKMHFDNENEWSGGNFIREDEVIEINSSSGKININD